MEKRKKKGEIRGKRRDEERSAEGVTAVSSIILTSVVKTNSFCHPVLLRHTESLLSHWNEVNQIIRIIKKVLETIISISAVTPQCAQWCTAGEASFNWFVKNDHRSLIWAQVSRLEGRRGRMQGAREEGDKIKKRKWGERERVDGVNKEGRADLETRGRERRERERETHTLWKGWQEAERRWKYTRGGVWLRGQRGEREREREREDAIEELWAAWL